MQNREGKLVSEDRDGSRYLVREWYVGRECDTASESEILAAVEESGPDPPADAASR